MPRASASAGADAGAARHGSRHMLPTDPQRVRHSPGRHATGAHRVAVQGRYRDRAVARLTANAAELDSAGSCSYHATRSRQSRVWFAEPVSSTPQGPSSPPPFF